MSRAVPWTRLRRTVQVAVLVFYLLLPLANRRGWRSMLGTLASLRLGPIDLTEPAAALSAALAAGAGGSLRALLLGAALPVLLALLLGPAFCAWGCPFGLASELLDVLLRRGRRWASDAARRARPVRLAALGLLLLLSAALATPLAALLQGPRAFSAAAQEAVYLGIASPAGAGLLGALLVLELLLPRRLFCRALCPSGAVLVPLRQPMMLRVTFQPDRCLCPGAPPCLHGCPWGVDPREERPGDGCTRCGACLEVCPSGALAFDFGRPHPPRAGSSTRPAEDRRNVPPGVPVERVVRPD